LPKQAISSKGSATVRVKDGLTVETRGELKELIQAAGIRPLAAQVVKSAQIVAKLPDGRIEPLVWLYQFDPKWGRAFTFRKPLELPPGTVIESSVPLRFALEISNSVTANLLH
jgi:hypothetical protein